MNKSGSIWAKSDAKVSVDYSIYLFIDLHQVDGGTYQCELRSINGVVSQVIHRVTVIGKCTQVKHAFLLMQMRQLVAVSRRYPTSTKLIVHAK